MEVDMFVNDRATCKYAAELSSGIGCLLNIEIKQLLGMIAQFLKQHLDISIFSIWYTTKLPHQICIYPLNECNYTINGSYALKEK